MLDCAFLYATTGAAAVAPGKLLIRLGFIEGEARLRRYSGEYH